MTNLPEPFCETVWSEEQCHDLALMLRMYGGESHPLYFHASDCIRSLLEQFHQQRSLRKQAQHNLVCLREGMKDRENSNEERRRET